MTNGDNHPTTEPTPGELRRWLERVDSDTRNQWQEMGKVAKSVARIEGKVDQLVRYHNGTAGETRIASLETDARTMHEMRGGWRLIGAALAVAIPAAFIAATAVIAWLEYSA